MKLDIKTCLRAGITIFLLYLCIHYWPAGAGAAGTVLGAAMPLILGAGMHQRELFQEVEDLLHKDMVACNDGLFVQ